MAYTVILGVTGSIAAYKACEIVTSLVKSGVEVVVVMTSPARQFITPLTFQTLSRNEVVTELFGPQEVHDPQHVSLSDRADLILIAPATANILGKLASGIAEDVLTCTVLASKAKVLIAPAMDDRMYNHPVVQGNIEKLKGIGYRFIGPVEGRLSSGRIGVGRMAPVEEIVRLVQEELKELASNSIKDIKVREPSGKSKG
ncbi:MAG TPA: flavoprotein [Candidatus Hypogeohydataceae bacterium YC41]